MYIVNIVKHDYLNGNVYIHHKSSTLDLKNVPNARADYILLHEISHKYKMSYNAFYKGSTYPTHL